MSDPRPDRTSRLPFDLDWNLLRTYLVIVEERGITAAAERLSLKQPTVSNALRRLEERLERKLIVRKPGRFEVTPEGDMLYQGAVEIFGTVSRLPVLLRRKGEEVVGHVTMALASHVVSPHLDEVLTEFHQRHPRATFTMDVSTSLNVATAVLQKRASLGICLVHKRLPQLQYATMFREYFGLYCGPRHKLFGKTGLDLSDLRGETFVSFQTDRLTDALRPVAMMRASAHIDGQRVATSSSLEEVRRLIFCGLGVGSLPLHIARADEKNGLLWRLPPYEDPPAIDIHLVWNPRAHFNRAEMGMLEMLRSMIESTPMSCRDYI
ncbi:LysR family transcriptional regulator [Roseinatronobacter monicus]|uniref:LysR family transcriptional regulator n=1 Tax=Roseinatronobacter monicus TaxID=393481 RepID=A0A543K3B0_9RHOB|nr:LysR family transcriptional regulator [Roseinatronobacter monicus]TQM89581.1 LysR family transcriptional regulator [Roseinatronobacter monicus]